MTIITVPHPTLRAQTETVTTVNPELKQLVLELGQTLKGKKNPQGVGLAAPQVNHSLKIFTTFLSSDGERSKSAAQIRVFINPEIVDHSDELTLGPNPKNPVLEGCLSIPGLYGPVPRWETVTYRFDELIGNELKGKTERFSDFSARVMQHEYDHLHGRLFTDYSLEYDLPVYQEGQDGKLEEIENYSILEIF